MQREFRGFGQSQGNGRRFSLRDSRNGIRTNSLQGSDSEVGLILCFNGIKDFRDRINSLRGFLDFRVFPVSLRDSLVQEADPWTSSIETVSGIEYGRTDVDVHREPYILNV
ncbi:hypothetical protein RJT34_27747 [Clitoria ternatea]|uniref:Uncharacterized protein n=1 Tax=Clitoria ternatea TaxID=43366 RepID=A0AAN9FD83_CLITE